MLVQDEKSDLTGVSAGSGGYRSASAWLGFLVLAVLMALLGLGPRAGILAMQSGQTLDTSSGPGRALFLAREERGRVAHAPRPVAKPLLSAGGGDDLLSLPYPAIAWSTGSAPLRPVAEAPRAWRPHRFGQPRAPPSVRLIA